MKDRHRSQVLLAQDFSLSPSVCSIDPKALQALIGLANWSAIWNLAGAIPKDITLSLVGRWASTRKTQMRILNQLTRSFCESYRPCLLDAGFDYQINPSLISFVRFGADWDKSEVHKVIARDQARCRYCGCECIDDLSIDHVFPRSRGGSDKPGNLVVACVSCNSRKGDRTPEEAGMPLLAPAKEQA